MSALWRWTARGVSLLVGLGVRLALLAAVGVVSVWALAHTGVVTSKLLSLAPGVHVVQADGAVLGNLKAQRVEVDLPRGGKLTLTEPTWQGMALHWDAALPWHVRLSMTQLHAKRLDLVWVADPAAPPSKAPTNLGLPLAINIEHLTLDEAHSALWGDTPLTQWQAEDVGINVRGPVATRVHRFVLHRLMWANWMLEGQAKVGTQGTLPVALSVRLKQNRSTAQGEGQAELTLNGPLADLAASGHAQWQVVGKAAQSLGVQAQLQPFAVWPLPNLAVKARAFNLAALVPHLPVTLLSGTLDVSHESKDDLLAKFDLRNAEAGPWDEARLPIQVLSGTVLLPHALQTMRWQQMVSLGQADLKAELPSVRKQALGHLAVKGQWQTAYAPTPIEKGKAAEPSQVDRAQLHLLFGGVMLQALDGRAPPLRLNGTASLSPSLAENSAKQAVWKNLRSAFQIDIQGEAGPTWAAKVSDVWRGLPNRPLNLRAHGEWEGSEVSLQSLDFASKDQRASLTDAQLRWASQLNAVPWSAKGQLKVDGFDPQIWLPWPDAVKGPNQLAGHVAFDLDARWHGTLQLQLASSTLAGLPIKGEGRWTDLLGQANASLSFDMDVAGNQLTGQGHWPSMSDRTHLGGWAPGLDGQQWRLHIHAPALSALKPITPLLHLAQLAGKVEGQVNANGHWPALLSDGQMDVSQFQWQAASASATGPAGALFKLDSASAQWQVDMHSMASPLQARLKLSGLSTGNYKIDQAQGVVQGTAQSHQAEFNADATFKRAASSDKQATKADSTTPVNTVAAGASESAPNGAATVPPPRSLPLHLAFKTQGAIKQTDGWAWAGKVQDLLLSTTSSSGSPQTLLQAPALELAWHQDLQARQLSMAPAHLQAMGVDLSLQHLSWRWPPSSADSVGDLDVQLQLMPLKLAALLARFQPNAGWGGDLTLTGDVKVQHTLQNRWVVDATVDRQAGDLSLSEPTIEGSTAQHLGINTAHVGLTSRDGTWVLTEQLDGRVLGKLTGRQVVRAVEPGHLPSGSDSLIGVMDVQIDNLRPWGVWTPPGWRLSGQLQGQAMLSGTLSAPQYRGQVKGQNLGIGQALLGVNVTDGELQMDLEGDEVRLTRFVGKGGSQGGTLSAQGEAALSPQPQVHVRLKADHFALLQRIDRRVVLSGEAQATLTTSDIYVNGHLNIDEGLIDVSRSDAPTVGDDVTVKNRPGKAAIDPQDVAGASPPATKRKMTATVDVNLGRQLRLRGRGLDALLNGSLRLTTPNNRPTLTGTVNAVDGTFAAYGQKLVLERGAITFTGPVENPRLDVLAMRVQSASTSSIVSSSDVKVGVAITGTAQDPSVTLYSEPAMSETEKLSWLVLGRAPTGLGGADLALLQTAAVALMSGDKASPSDNLIGMLGLDELSVHQTDGTVRDTVVNVGKQVSRFWYVGYERNLNATGGNWQMIYRLAQRFTLRLQAGEDNAVDLIRSWRWD